jgi:hypothetical protein
VKPREVVNVYLPETGCRYQFNRRNNVVVNLTFGRPEIAVEYGSLPNAEADARVRRIVASRDRASANRRARHEVRQVA